MGYLINSFDKEFCFSDLNEAKYYFYNLEEIEKNDDNAVYLIKFNVEVANAADLDELASILNKYTDILGNGSCFKVVDDILEFDDVGTSTNIFGNGSEFKLI